MNKIPVFRTKRLILRGVTEEDAAAWSKHFVDYAVISKLARAVPWPYPDGGVLDFIRMQILPRQGKDRWVWSICLKDELIGCVDLYRNEDVSKSNRGFWLGQPYWGQGFMTEAIEPVTDYAFDELGFERLVLDNAKGNLPSRKIKERMGARLVRVEPAEFVNPAYTEKEVWELTRDEWKGRSLK